MQNNRSKVDKSQANDTQQYAPAYGDSPQTEGINGDTDTDPLSTGDTQNATTSDVAVVLSSESANSQTTEIVVNGNQWAETVGAVIEKAAESSIAVAAAIAGTCLQIYRDATW